MTKGDSLKGSTLELTRDGKFKLQTTADGQTMSREGTFDLVANTLTATDKSAESKRIDKLKKKELTDKKLVLEGDQEEVIEFAKK